jgi:V/A-type H+-transporting ATPase subunit E
MSYEQLIESVETSGEEKIRDLRDKADREAVQIIKEAENKEDPIKKKHLDAAKRSVESEKNRLLATANEEIRLQLTRVKDEMYQTAVAQALSDLQSVRNHPGYEKIFKEFLQEAYEELRGEKIEIHIDKRDEGICRKLVSELSINGDIVTDITSAGGMNISTKDGRFVVFNTVESRFERAKVLLRPEIFATIFGDSGGV